MITWSPEFQVFYVFDCFLRSFNFRILQKKCDIKYCLRLFSSGCGIEVNALFENVTSLCFKVILHPFVRQWTTKIMTSKVYVKQYVKQFVKQFMKQFMKQFVKHFVKHFV